MGKLYWVERFIGGEALLEFKGIHPALIFPEFEGEWQRVKTRNIAKISSGSTPLRSNKDFQLEAMEEYKRGLLQQLLL